MIRKVAIAGATGMLGIPVVQQLIAGGIEVTALVRNPVKAKLPAGVRPVTGDLKDIAGVDELIKNQDALYISLSVLQNERENDWHAEGEGLANLLASAKKHSIQRILFLSSLVQRYQGMNGFYWWVFDLKDKAIEQVKAAGIPYTIFYPSTFMESFLGKYRQGSRIMLSGTSEYPMYYIAGEDYGRQVVRSLQLPQDRSYEFVVQGPEPLTQDEATVIFLSNYRKEKLSAMKVPFALVRFFGLFGGKANYGAHVIEALNRYPEKFESEEAWKLLVKPTVTMKEFAGRL